MHEKPVSMATASGNNEGRTGDAQSHAGSLAERTTREEWRSPNPRGARPVRVLRIIARLNVGGPAIHTILLADRMRAHGFATTLVTGVTGPSEGDMLDLAAEND